MENLSPEALGVDVAPRYKTLKVTEPPKRHSGKKVANVAELVDKLGVELLIVGHSRHQSLAMRWWRGATDALLVEKIRCSLLVAMDPKHDE